MSATHTTTEKVAVERVELDPRTLLLDVNVRQDPRLDKDFLASIKDLGVLMPIVAVRTANGDVRVRFGHRRTLAAIEVGLPSVPVDIVGDESSDDASQIDRIVSQYAENEHRTALSASERVGVVEQLSAFGMSATQIQRRTRIQRRSVSDALAVAGSELAKAATARYDFLTLEAAAALAEFQDEPEIVKELVVAAKNGRFDHTVQRLRDTRAERAAQAAARSALEAAGVTVIDRPTWTSPITRLSHLVGNDGARLTEQTHRGCPGHAAFLEQEWVPSGDSDEQEESQDEATDDDDLDGEDDDYRMIFHPVYVCLDPQAHGHISPSARSGKPNGTATEEDKEAAKAERRRVLRNNAAWRSAETVRREWLRSLLARRTAPKGALRYVLTALARGDWQLCQSMGQGHELGRELLGLSGDEAGRYGADRSAILTALDAANDARAQVIALGLILGDYEAHLGVHSWRNPNGESRQYLAALVGWGYEPSEVEQLVLGNDQEADEATDG